MKASVFIVPRKSVEESTRETLRELLKSEAFVSALTDVIAVEAGKELEYLNQSVRGNDQLQSQRCQARIDLWQSIPSILKSHGVKARVPRS
jgi:plasmid stability protein